MRRNAVCMVSRGAERRSSCTVICTYPVGYIGMSNAICALGSCSVNAVAGDRIFIGQSTIGTSLFELETPYADPHVRCCERCDAKTSAYLIPRSGNAPCRQAAGDREAIPAERGDGRLRTAENEILINTVTIQNPPHFNKAIPLLRSKPDIVINI